MPGHATPTISVATAQTSTSMAAGGDSTSAEFHASSASDVSPASASLDVYSYSFPAQVSTSLGTTSISTVQLMQTADRTVTATVSSRTVSASNVTVAAVVTSVSSLSLSATYNYTQPAPSELPRYGNTTLSNGVVAKAYASGSLASLAAVTLINNTAGAYSYHYASHTWRTTTSSTLVNAVTGSITTQDTSNLAVGTSNYTITTLTSTTTSVTGFPRFNFSIIPAGPLSSIAYSTSNRLSGSGVANNTSMHPLSAYRSTKSSTGIRQQTTGSYASMWANHTSLLPMVGPASAKGTSSALNSLATAPPTTSACTDSNDILLTVRCLLMSMYSDD